MVEDRTKDGLGAIQGAALQFAKGDKQLIAISEGESFIALHRTFHEEERHGKPGMAEETMIYMQGSVEDICNAAWELIKLGANEVGIDPVSFSAKVVAGGMLRNARMEHTEEYK